MIMHCCGIVAFVWMTEIQELSPPPVDVVLAQHDVK